MKVFLPILQFSFRFVYTNSNHVIMKSIKFTEQELEFLRTQYQLEMVEAEKYVQEVKNLLVKLGVKPTKTESVPERKSRRGRKKVEPPKETSKLKSKRGRKPKVEALPDKTDKPEKVSKAEKKPRVTKKKSKLVRKPEPVPVPEKNEPTPEKKVILKPKTKKKQSRRKGVVLKSLSKPLPKKDISPILSEAESPATE